MKATIIISFLFILSVSNFEIKLVDDYFIEVEIGNPKTKLKLIAEPSLPFIYLFTEPISNTVEKLNFSLESNSVFATFFGKWRKDEFNFISENKNIKANISYLQIKNNIYNSKFNCDGIFGLAYNSYKESYVKDMYTELGIKKIFSYDKKKKILTFGKLPNKQEYNNTFIIPIMQENDKKGYFFNLTAIGCIINNELQIFKVKNEENAMITFMPIIVAPFFEYELLKKFYFKDIKKEGTGIFLYEERNLIFSEIYFYEKSKNSINDSLIFIGNQSYRFNTYYEKSNNFISNLKLGDVPGNEFYVWYIGLDLINIDRADFNYENNTVTFYSIMEPVKPKIKGQSIIIPFIILVLLILSLSLSKYFFIKRKKDEIDDKKEDKELIEM